MKNAILNAFNIRKGEETAISLLLLYSFFMGSVIAFFYTTATSMFVVNFESSVLPYAYIGGGIMSYLVWLVYARVERAVSFPNLMLLGITLLLLSVGFFVAGIQYFNNKWLTFLMFVWIRVFVFISAVGFWGLATKMFDFRQGKRIFGLISSGEVISDIVGFFSIPLVLKLIDTSHLLYISLFGLVICFLLITYMLQRFKNPLKQSERKEEKEMDTSFKFMFKDKYLTLLILMAVLPMFGMCFADFSFLHQIKIEFSNQALIASFLSIFFGATAVAEFILKSFFSGRLLNKYGLKVALPILPVVLAGCVFLAISAGVLYGTTGLFFSFIAFTKMIDRVLRSAIYDPSYQILYQPLRAEDRFNAQGMVEGMAKGLGFALAGAVVLLFTRYSILGLVEVNILFILILGLWVKLSFDMYQTYRGSLSKILTSKGGIRSESSKCKSNSSVLSKIMLEEKQPNLSLLMNIMAHVEPQKVHRFLRRILDSSPIGQQEKILEQVQAKRMLSAEPIIKDYLLSNPEIPNKELFERTQASLQEARKEDFETLEQLAQSPDAKKRTLAANLLAHSKSYKTYKILLALLQDDDPETIKAAIISSGHIGKRELWPPIIRYLFDNTYSCIASSALKIIGEPILPELEHLFDKITTTKDVRIKIISIYSGIKGEKPMNLLRSRIQYPDETIRHQVFKALSKMGYRAKLTDISLIKETIDEEIAITVWVMAALLDIQKEKKMAILDEALQYELIQKKENVFLLLSMLYDSKTIRYIQESFKTGTHESRVYAAEMLDITVSTEVKEIFLPLLDDLSLEDSLRLFNDNYPQQRMTVAERLNDIINKDYLKINRWTKACAIMLLENYPDNERVLLSNFMNPDPFIMQSSVILLKKQNSERFRYILEKLDNDKISLINKYSFQQENELPDFLLSDKVNFVKQNHLFSALSYPDIARIIENSTAIVLHAGEEINAGKIALDSIFFVLSGTITTYINGLKIRNLNEIDFYWGIVNDSEDEVILKAENNASLLVLSPELIFNAMLEDNDYTREVISLLSKTA
jgi:ATP/ADP translocase/HEAT repeat protein